MKIEEVSKLVDIVSLLTERYEANSRMYNILSSKIIEQWITEAYAKVKNKISLKGFRSVQDSLKNPQKKYDYFLLYVVGCMQSNSTADTFVKIDYTVKNHKIPFVFAVQNDCSLPEGHTEGKYGHPKSVFISLPLAQFNKIYKKIKNGTINYSLVEEFIAFLQTAVSHELTHGIQFINKTYKLDSSALLSKLEETKVQPITYLLYFTRENEIDATMSQAYTAYKHQGSGIMGRNKDIKKTFFRCLINVVLTRWAKINGIKKRFNTGTLSFQEILSKLTTLQKLILVWSIFVYGLKYSGFDKLLRQDDNISYKEFVDTNLIEANIKNIKSLFIWFVGHEDLQQEWAKVIENYSPQKRTKLFAKLFSIKKSNKETADLIKNWLFDRLNTPQ